MEPRFTFDRIAPLYDEVRAGYPSRVFELLASHVPAGGSVLEVGCGTGKATVGFAAQGLDIVALDPGPSMISQAQENLKGYARIEFVHSTFEGWTDEGRLFDMVASAQAWHWAPPEIGVRKAAALLRPGGVLAIFGNDWEPIDQTLREATDKVYVRLAPELRNSPLGTWYRSDGPVPEMIGSSRLFRDLRYEAFGWSRTLYLDVYLAMLRTLSNHQGLGPDRLDGLLNAVEDAARPFGETVELSYTTHLHHCSRL